MDKTFTTTKEDAMRAIHLTNPNTVHALCARFARRPRVTTDQSKVTCGRCRKLAVVVRDGETRVVTKEG
jgi:hypothetical protein